MDNFSRTIRFKQADIEKIEEFLKINPIFDFSSLTRFALKEFIQNPKIQLRPISKIESDALNSSGDIQ